MKFIVSVFRARRKFFSISNWIAGFKVFSSKLYRYRRKYFFREKHSKDFLLCLLPYERYINEFSMSINCANVKRPLKDFRRKKKYFILGWKINKSFFPGPKAQKPVENSEIFPLLFINPKAMEWKETHEKVLYFSSSKHNKVNCNESTTWINSKC